VSALLEARRITKVFNAGRFSRRRTVALEDFSLAIAGEPPSITAIVGESGSGKTTLARLLLGIVPPTTGEVLYQGQDVRQLSPAARRVFRRDIQIIFQDPYDSYNPFYKIDHVLQAPIANFQLANRCNATRSTILPA